MRYVLLLLLASCASGHSEFHRGTMGAPPAAPARPGVGAPIRGQPGEPHAYPRSPYTRVLPETPETRHGPGLWAADATLPPPPPMRKKGEPIPKIRVLDIPVPHHENATDALDTGPTEQCAGAVNAVLMGGDAALASRALRLTPNQRECLAALAHMDCLSDLKPRLDRVADAVTKERAAWALDAAVRWTNRACAKSEPSREVPDILSAMTHGNRPGGQEQ